METRYDAIVLGAGPGGEVCAGALGAAGMRVAVLERELIGGECAYWACVPTKTLLRPGEALLAARRAPGARAAVAGAVDAADALAWRDRIVHRYDDSGQLPWLTSRGVEVVRGQARLAGRGRVEVDGRALLADRVVLATGSEPVIPPIPGLRELPGVWTNRDAVGMRAVPRRLLVLGGGAIGVELAQIAARLGARVVVVEGEERLLAREPAQIGAALADALRADGIEVVLGARATAAALDDVEYVLRFDDRPELRGDRLLVATGRRPRVDDLGLETVGIEPSRRGVEVDERLRAGEGVWAIGDVNGILQFTHVAKYHGRVAAEDILGEPVRADHRAVPRVIYTDPQAAAVGESEGRFTATVAAYDVARASTYEDDPASHPGFLTLVSDGEALTGAYAVGPDAGEWIGQATLAVRARVPLAVLRDTVQPYPTFSELIALALDELRAAIRERGRTRPANGVAAVR
jgi:pyruvate/2-oxoglutarate dehydrogenase complex dihydrolipoamide dehydrogenase (E3) component